MSKILLSEATLLGPDPIYSKHLCFNSSFTTRLKEDQPCFYHPYTCSERVHITALNNSNAKRKLQDIL